MDIRQEEYLELMRQYIDACLEIDSLKEEITFLNKKNRIKNDIRGRKRITFNVCSGELPICTLSIYVSRLRKLSCGHRFNK